MQGTAYGRKDKMPTLLGNITIAMRDGAHVNDALKLFVLADGHAGPRDSEQGPARRPLHADAVALCGPRRSRPLPSPITPHVTLALCE